MKDKVVGGMQNFSKAMIGPVLFLPVVGMLIALTAIATNTAIVTDGGFIWTAGKYFNGMLNPIMGNLSILFCVGIAMGMSKKKESRRCLRCPDVLHPVLRRQQQMAGAVR